MPPPRGLKRNPATKSDGGDDAKGKPSQPIFCEILDQRTQQLIESHPTLGDACHFLVSNRLISKIMAMVSEDRAVAEILNILLSGELSMCLKPSSLLVAPSEFVSFFVLQKRAQRIDMVHRASLNLRVGV